MGPERSPHWLAAMAILVVAELGWRVARGHGYDRRTAFATLGLVIGGLPFAALQAWLLGIVFDFAWRHAPAHLPADHWVTWALGFVAVEFAYYWFHRASHRIRWLWASHAVHHSAEQMTLLASLRLGWTNLLSAGWLLYVPLVLLGLPPLALVALLAFNLHYQFLLHTEAVGELGPLEWVFNTPAHHRRHHASNAAYIDRNYGGVTILFDRWFGTLAQESPGEALRYGLAHRRPSANPLVLALREWALMLRDATRAPSASALARTLFAPPPGSDA